MNYLVLDFGGSAVKCAVMDDKANVLKRFSVPSQADSYHQWLDRLAPEFDLCQKEYDLQGIAISSCGSVDVDTGIIHGASALPYIHGFDVKSLYQQRFNLPVEIENDACCAALAESWLGAGKDSDHFCFVVIGSGIGGAIVSEQKIVKGHHLHGGEFGYTILTYQNNQAKTFSDLGATAALVNAAAKALNQPADTLNGEIIFARYQQGDAVISQVVDEWLMFLATGLYNIQFSIDPEVIILGGAISGRADLISLIEQRLDRIYQQVPIATIRPQLKTSSFANDANLIGALKHFFTQQAKSLQK